ncbi:MAG: hypothetical protein PSN37_06355, partial [Alphaproteobacteria bacterium]|nr:hypothetical protein [Alphaproteobacteria bacterium]
GLPLRNDTVARLEHQGLTGIANVQLRGGALNAPLLFAEGKGIATIVAEKSFFSSFVGLSESLLARLSLILDDVHSLINKNENAVTRNVENIGIFTANLASNTEKIPLLFENISTLVKRLDSMSSNLDDLIVGIKPLASKNSVSLLGNVNLLLENVNILLSENRERLGETMVHFDEFSDFLVSSSDNIKDMILNVGDAANKIGQVSTHFGSLVVRLDKILDRDGGKFFYEAQLAIENFRDFSENMGLSAQLINEQLSQLTGNNFNKLNVLFAKGQDALQDVQGVVERFDRHPLRFFSGTPEIREYSYE